MRTFISALSVYALFTVAACGDDFDVIPATRGLSEANDTGLLCETDEECECIRMAQICAETPNCDVEAARLRCLEEPTDGMCVAELPAQGAEWGPCDPTDAAPCSAGFACSTFEEIPNIGDPVLLGTMCVPNTCSWDEKAIWHCPPMPFDSCGTQLAGEVVCAGDDPLRDSPCILHCDPDLIETGCADGLVCLGDRCMHPAS